MRALFCLVLATACLCVTVPAYAEPFRAGQSFDQEQMARVTAAALAFMAPRILQQVPVEQLAMWGLRGLTTLDPRLSPTLDDATLRLALLTADGPRPLLQRPAPGDADATGWGGAAAQMARTAWNAAQPVRRAGTEGIVRTFFDELFNHLDPYSRYVPAWTATQEATNRIPPGGAPPARTVLASRHGSALVLRILSFGDGTAAELAQAVQDGLAGTARNRPRGLVFDLRSNRGGILVQAAEAAATVLAQGIEASTEGRDPQATHVFAAEGQDLSGGLPVVVLVDGRTASAAEIMAAALADQSRAVVVGSATFGKGLVQTILDLPGGGLLYVTWSRVLAPRGWPIQMLGVLPQVCTSLGETATRRQLAALSVGTQTLAGDLARERDARAPVTAEAALAIRAACPAAVGRDLDMTAAAYLLAHPAAYAAALLPPLQGEAADRLDAGSTAAHLPGPNPEVP